MKRPSVYTRGIPRLLIYLIVGIVTTYAVALIGTAAYPQSRSIYQRSTSGTSDSRWVTPFSTVTSMIELASDHTIPESDAPAYFRKRAASQQFEGKSRLGASMGPTPDWEASWRIHESGWPCRSSWGWSRTDLTNESFDEEQGGLLRFPKVPHELIRDLPCAPLYRGLILNTFFYAVVWWALLALPRLICRTLRARRGLCTRCAYDLRGTPNSPCPECGHTPTRHNARTVDHSPSHA